MSRAIILVDLQYDFMEDGALGVPGANEEFIDSIVGLVKLGTIWDNKPFDVIVASQDFHPKDHISFASRHDVPPFSKINLLEYNDQPIMGFPEDAPIREMGVYRKVDVWPDHCVQGTKGAALHRRLNGIGVDIVVQKGYDQDREAYSAFDAIIPAIGMNLEQALKNFGVTEVVVVGLALAECVTSTAIDSVRAGFETTVYKKYTRSIRPQNDTETVIKLVENGVTVI
jgi:nicotinamidase-related amidase